MAASTTGEHIQISGIPWSWFNKEKWRLFSFSKYPQHAAKSALLLAENGFVYIGKHEESDDLVICFFCESSKRGWRKEESIKETHRNLNSDCPMVTGASCDNLPIGNPKNHSNNGMSQSHSENTTSQGRGLPGQSAQAPQQVNGLRQQTHPRKAVQMATVTVMRPAAAEVRNRSLDAAQSQALANDLIPTQPRDDGGPSSIATSRDTGAVYSNHYRTPERISTVNANSSLGNSASAQSPFQDNTALTNGNSSPSARHHFNRVPQDQSMNLLEPTRLSNPSLPAHAQTTPQSTSTSSEQPENLPHISNTTPNSENPPDNPPSTTNRPANPENPSANHPSITNRPANPENPPANPPSTTNGPANPENPPANPPNPTYAQLGIITERPKRYEYAVRLKRLDTFTEWPADHHLKKEELADAGFYYAGYDDCARCFYCGGGLRNWDGDDDVWVEHARWFPKCAFMRQRVGQDFINVVADFAKDFEKITFKMVVDKMRIDPALFQIENKQTALKNDPAVKTMSEMGFRDQDIIQSVTLLKEFSQMLSADELYDVIVDRGAIRQPTQNPVFECVEPSSDKERDKEVINKVKQSNSDLRLLCTCKVCMDKEVAIVFLPCGHMVCCTECSSAMRDCPICRKQVKGFVRGFMA